MTLEEMNTTTAQLQTIRNEDNSDIVDNAICCIKELSSEQSSLLSAYEDCANRLREVTIENNKLKNFVQTASSEETSDSEPTAEKMHERIKRMTEGEMRSFIYLVYMCGNRDCKNGLYDTNKSYFGNELMSINAADLMPNDNVIDLWHSWNLE